MSAETFGNRESFKAMPRLSQKWVPGIVGISTYVDWVYHKEIQLEFVKATGSPGPINQLRVVTVTLDFKTLIANLQSGRREAAEEQVSAAAAAIEAGGADFIVVTSGTTSTLTALARERVAIPFLDLAESAWADIAAVDSAAVGLLSTRYAAAGGIFQAAATRRGARLILPPPETAERVDKVIFGELVCGLVTDEAVHVLGAGIADLVAHGAGSIILGNTDMTLAADRLRATAPVPLIDSARAHAKASARAAVAGRL